jgi:uncharacterized membrane protein
VPVRSPARLIVVTLLVTPVALWANNEVIRLVAAVPLVFFLPGTALAAALLGDEEDRWVGAALSLGLSLAVAAIGGVVLNLSPWGLVAGSWAALLSVITLAGALAGFVRRDERTGHRGVPGRSADRWAAEQRSPVRSGGVGGSAVLVTAGLLAAVALAVAQFGAAHAGRPAFTQLWMVPTSSPDGTVLRIGILNQESTALRFELRVQVDGATVHRWPSLAIPRGSEWRETFVLPAAAARARTIEVVLYRSDGPESPYRHVRIWRPATQGTAP